jgi:1,2-diacylglycerol 3-beta-glucosyltransferase
MSIAPYIFLSFAAVYITFQFILLARLLYYYKPVPLYKSEEQPLISILIAARNEEESILSCLKAIENLNYPEEKIEVWIGDDQSTDATYTLVSEFIQNKPNHWLLPIQPASDHLKGKANVLAQLARKAQGEFFFITDADIHVPEYWIEGLLGAFESTTGIVSGATVVKASDMFSKIQRTDWAYAFGMVHVVSEMNMPVSAVGNNMAIRKSCYESTGGYENIPFSVTEDLELFKAALKKGWGYRNLLHAESTAVSAPLNNLTEVLHQRKRWLSGAMRLPVLLLVFLTMQAFYFPVLVAACFYLPVVWVFVFWLTIFNLQNIFIELVSSKLGIHSLRNNVLLFELNRYIFPLVLLSYHVLPFGVHWKGRTYKGKDVQP